MDRQQRESIGAEIGRIRWIRPRITVSQLAEAAQLAPNTISAVLRGTSNDESVARVLEALAALGRPVQIVTPADEAPQEVTGAHPAQLIGDLVTAILRSAPPEEAQELERLIWLLVRGRNDELIAQLSSRGNSATAS